jgi:hypothetical protein
MLHRGMRWDNFMFDTCEQILEDAMTYAGHFVVAHGLE